VGGCARDTRTGTGDPIDNMRHAGSPSFVDWPATNPNNL